MIERVEFSEGSRVIAIHARAQVELPHVVKWASPLGACVIVLFDPDGRDGNVGVFANLCCISEDGTERWCAQPPTTTTGDCYTRVIGLQPLTALSWSGYRVKIDPASGKLLSREFLK